MIASWILYSMVVSACAACIALVAEAMLRAARRPTRWLWVGTFAAAVVIPALVAVRPSAGTSPLPLGNLILPEASRAPIVASSAMSLDAWLGAAWIAAALVVAVVLLAGLVQLSRARRRADRGTLAGREVALTDDLGPGALPFGEPKILVPRWASSLPLDTARLLVTHEEEHVRAGDARLLVGAAVVLAAIPWNVVLWWALRRMRTAIELDCDARVLRGEESVAPYAELLLQVAGRGRAAPALLALTDSTSQLKTRIDAMTIARVLTPVRRAVLGALAVGALVVACETRRPDPVAPVTDYALKDGHATAIASNPQLSESVKVRVAGSLKAVEPGSLAGDSKAPVVMVHDATGQVIFAGRIDSNSVLKQIPPSDIATVEVVKRSDLLPSGVSEGLVTVRLKPEASWKSPTAGDTSVHYKSLGSTGDPDGRALSTTESDERATTAFPHLRVVLENAAGAVVYTGNVTMEEFRVGAGPYRVAREDIATVNIDKGGPLPTLTIRLKEGARVEKR